MANNRSVGGGGGVSLLDTALQCVVVEKLGNELRTSFEVPGELPRELLTLVRKIKDQSEDR